MDHSTGKDDNKGITLLSPEVLTTRVLQTFQLRGEEADLLKEICKANRDRHHEESVAKAVQYMHLFGGREIHKDEWTEDQDVLFYRGKVYVPKVEDLQCKITQRHHDSKVGGHLGRFKTLQLVS